MIVGIMHAGPTVRYFSLFIFQKHFSSLKKHMLSQQYNLALTFLSTKKTEHLHAVGQRQTVMAVTNQVVFASVFSP
jgi:hypothetical protein